MRFQARAPRTFSASPPQAGKPVAALGEGFAIKWVLADTGFYLIAFIEDLESQGYRYIIAAPMSEIVQREIRRVRQWRAVDEGIEVGEFWFKHLDRKWKRARRYVVVRQEIAKRPKAAGKQPSLFRDLEEWKQYRFSVMITSDTASSPGEIWREYRPRANDENVIKDLKEGYGFAAFSLNNFWATEAVMVMNALVFHNLVHYLNRNILSGSGPVQQLRTLRSKLLILPAQLGRCAGQSVLRLGVRDRSFRGKIRYSLERINALPWRVNCNAVDGGGGVS